MQIYGVNYWETYSPVVRWSTIRVILTISIMNGWYTRQLDFVLAYPQAPVECDLYMAIPYGYKIQDPKRYALQLKKNLYGQKQAGRVWNKYLTKLMLDAGFIQSEVDECMFYFNDCIVLIYVDDTLICGPQQTQVDHVVAVLATLFDVEDQGDINDYLGVKLTKLQDGKFMLTQPHLIKSIISDMGLPPHTNAKETPALISKPLQPDPNGSPFQQPWSYRSIIGKLNFLEKSTRPDLAYAVHQCARFTADPRASHGEAVKRIVRYLIGTADKGFLLAPNKHSFECWADADYAGNWNREFAMEDIWNGAITLWLPDHLCWLSNSMGIALANRDCTQHYRG
jgi:histone deacetylase 1/2